MIYRYIFLFTFFRGVGRYMVKPTEYIGFLSWLSSLTLLGNHFTVIKTSWIWSVMNICYNLPNHSPIVRHLRYFCIFPLKNNSQDSVINLPAFPLFKPSMEVMPWVVLLNLSKAQHSCRSKFIIFTLSCHLSLPLVVLWPVHLALGKLSCPCSE